MKPARREAYFSCLKSTVEHSINSIELLYKPVFLLSGRYTNFEMKKYVLSEGVNAYKYGKVVFVSIFENFATGISSGEYILSEDIIPVDTVRAILYGSPFGSGADVYLPMWCAQDSHSLLWGTSGQVITSLRGFITYLCK